MATKRGRYNVICFGSSAGGLHALIEILPFLRLDGALGIQAVRSKGGFTIVQDPSTAESTGMPGSAIATGAVDLILPLNQIGKTIVELVTPAK